MQIGILEPEKFSTDAILILKKIGNVIMYDGSNLKKFLSSLNVLFVRLSHNIDEDFLKNCPNLEWLCSPTTGHNHLDIEHMSKKKIKVLTLRGETRFLKAIKATPEHTFGLILALLRRYGIAIRSIADGEWERNKCRGEELFSNKVGLIGLGRVGTQVANYCDAFGAKIMYYDKKKINAKSNWIKLDNILELINKSRIVVLCANYNYKQPPIIGKKEIKLLKNKFFINSSRGELIDEEILMNATKRGDFAGVALDVISNENSKNNLRHWQDLTKNKNVIITPHIGGLTKESLRKTEIFIAKKLNIAISEKI